MSSQSSSSSNKMDDLFAGTAAAEKPKTKTIEVEYDFAGESVKYVFIYYLCSK